MCSNYWNEAALGGWRVFFCLFGWSVGVHSKAQRDFPVGVRRGMEKPKIYILEMLFPLCLVLNFPIPRFVSNFFLTLALVYIFLGWR